MNQQCKFRRNNQLEITQITEILTQFTESGFAVIFLGMSSLLLLENKI